MQNNISSNDGYSGKIPYNTPYTNDRTIVYTVNGNYTVKPTEYIYTTIANSSSNYPTTTTINTSSSNYPSTTISYYGNPIKDDKNVIKSAYTIDYGNKESNNAINNNDNIKSSTPSYTPITTYEPITSSYTYTPYSNYGISSSLPKYEPTTTPITTVTSNPTSSSIHKPSEKSSAVSHNNNNNNNNTNTDSKHTNYTEQKYGNYYVPYTPISQSSTELYNYTPSSLNQGISTNYVATTSYQPLSDYTYTPISSSITTTTPANISLPTTTTTTGPIATTTTGNTVNKVEKSTPVVKTEKSNNTQDNIPKYLSSTNTIYSDYKPLYTPYTTSISYPSISISNTNPNQNYTYGIDHVLETDKKIIDNNKPLDSTNNINNTTKTQPIQINRSTSNQNLTKDQNLPISPTSYNYSLDFKNPTISYPSISQSSTNNNNNNYTYTSTYSQMPSLSSTNQMSSSSSSNNNDNKHISTYEQEISKKAAVINANNTTSIISKASGKSKNKNVDQKIYEYEVKTVYYPGGIVKQIKDFMNDENSKFNTLFKQHKSTKQKFTDSQFPPNLQSLTGGLSEDELKDQHGDCGFEWNTLIWCRPDEFYGKNMSRMYNNNQISGDNIQQGALGDCYFLSVLASLGTIPHRIQRLLITKEVNEYGLYGIRICDMGEWQDIILDDYVPCFSDDKQPVFSKGNNNELWVLLLEKAWAKLYGSYAKIEAGLTREALHDLTGAPTKFYITEGITDDEKDRLWQDIKQGEKMNYVMTCGAADFYGGLDELTEVGIVASHAYTVLNAYDVDNTRGKEKIVKLRNPWDKAEWTGDWNIKSPLWTPQIKKQLNFKDNDLNEFYMSYNDFLTYFSDAQICKIHDDFHYTSLKANANYKNATFFKMTVNKPGKYYISVNQQSKRHYEKSENFRYSAVWIVLAKVNEQGGYTHIEGCFKDDREVWTDNHLELGEYVIYVKIAWFDKTIRDFVISSYGPDDLLFIQVKKAEVPRFIEKVYYDKGRKSKKTESYADLGQPNCFRAVELTEEGYGFIYYQNNTNKTLNEQINFNSLDGLKLCKPYKGNQYQIKVGPNEEKVVLLKIDPDAETVRQSFSERARFE